MQLSGKDKVIFQRKDIKVLSFEWNKLSLFLTKVVNNEPFNQ
jgi:hypothetical protein